MESAFQITEYYLSVLDRLFNITSDAIRETKTYITKYYIIKGEGKFYLIEFNIGKKLQLWRIKGNGSMKVYDLLNRKFYYLMRIEDGVVRFGKLYLKSIDKIKAIEKLVSILENRDVYEFEKFLKENKKLESGNLESISNLEFGKLRRLLGFLNLDENIKRQILFMLAF